MTPHVLNGAIVRVARAKKHLTDLHGELADWLVEQENAIVAQFNPQPPHNFLADVSKCIGPPLIVGVLIGEIAYNLRSALDYLVFELAKLDSGAEQKGTQFPIEDKPESFRGNAPRMLVGLNPTHIAQIERYQPYNNGCNWIARLRDLSNPDKHRHLIPGKGVAGITVHSSLERNDLDRIQGFERYAPHPTLGNVKVKVHNAISITLDDGTPVVYMLEEIQSQVAKTLREFDPDFA